MSAFLTDRGLPLAAAVASPRLFGGDRVGYRLADAIVTTSAGVADDLVAAFGVRAAPHPGRPQSGRPRRDRGRGRRAARSGARSGVDASGDRRRRPARRREELSAAASTRWRCCGAPCRRGCSSSARAIAKRRCASASSARSRRTPSCFCGFQRNPWKYIARADVFALTSRYEGFGNVLVEAMACGVPVVATASPGTREIVTDGVDGLLVDRHEPDAVAAALAARARPTPALRQRLADAARAAARSASRCRPSRAPTTACCARSRDCRADRAAASGALASACRRTSLGIAYTLSPLTVWAAWRSRCSRVADRRGLPEPAERRRVQRDPGRRDSAFASLAIAGLLLITDHARVPFGSFFGDEEYFMRRVDLAAQRGAGHSDP